jgi:hypothetical protein
MKTWLIVGKLVLMSVCACVLTGCASFFCLQGGGPLKLDEVGDWAGISAAPSVNPEQLKSAADKLRSQEDSIFAGRVTIQGESWLYRMNWWIDPRSIPFLPARGMRVAQNAEIWSRLIPSVRHDERLYYSESPGSREFYAAEAEWGCGMLIGDFIAAGDQSDAYDVATGVRVAARKTMVVLTLLGYCREQRVLPVDSNGTEGLHALSDPKLDRSDVLWNVKDGTVLLGGILGWGTVNDTRYIQVLFIPIPVGTVKR